MTFKHCSSTSFILFMDVNILYCNFQNDFIVKTQKITTTNINTPFLVKINQTSICRQTNQFAYKHINLLTSISICRQTYQFADKYINLPTNLPKLPTDNMVGGVRHPTIPPFGTPLGNTHGHSQGANTRNTSCGRMDESAAMVL